MVKRRKIRLEVANIKWMKQLRITDLGCKNMISYPTLSYIIAMTMNMHTHIETSFWFLGISLSINKLFECGNTVIIIRPQSIHLTTVRTFTFKVEVAF